MPHSSPRTFISELKVQLDVIDSEIVKAEERCHRNRMGIPTAPQKEWDRLASLRARRRIIVDKIIEHDP